MPILKKSEIASISSKKTLSGGELKVGKGKNYTNY